MKLSGLTLFALFIFSNLNFASATTEAVTPMTSVTESTAAGVDTRSSRFHRENKSYQITGQAFSIVTPEVMPTFGVNFSKFLTRDKLLQLEYSTGEEDSWTSSEFKTQMAGVHFKTFTANSLYLNFGVDYRKLSMSYAEDCFIFCSNDYSRQQVGHSEAIFASVGLGNQWQWRSFTMGCDWLTISSRLVKLNEHVSTVGLGTDGEYARQDWNDGNDDVVLQFTRFYLGASF